MKINHHRAELWDRRGAIAPVDIHVKHLDFGSIGVQVFSRRSPSAECVTWLHPEDALNLAESLVAFAKDANWALANQTEARMREEMLIDEPKQLDKHSAKPAN